MREKVLNKKKKLPVGHNLDGFKEDNFTNYNVTLGE